ncbi:hypothetical protein Ddye_022374 [Dipteronia dyeriana]|uniref:PGG domain-containing protein n=1 Tax=Dipteronia dyeriana TaxID=168575 RepID=A0AAD9U4G2_9ROSI|nr:hypothetical protein Ddye_022374 [Dipteronia dyeriana]
MFVTKALELCPNLLCKANNKGETLLHFAARYGHGDLVKELIEESKKPHNKDLEHGVEATRLMLGKTNNEAKDTALHEAIRYNHIDVVNKLIEADPDLPYEANGCGETPLYLAAERGYIEIVKKILGTCKSSPADHGPMNRTALHASVIRKDKEMTTELLREKANLINKEDEQGRLPLHYAAYLGYDDIVDVLLDKDPCTAYKADKEGKRALHLAAGNGKASAVDKLISKCPSCCELVDNEGSNALHLALASENYETVDLVLKNPLLGNLVNQKDKKGNTPLLQLAASGSYIKSFIRHSRVDKLAFNCDNQNAADIILAKDLIVESQELFLDGLDMIKANHCRRIIVPKEEISRERKVNRLPILGLRKENVKAKDECDEIIDKIKEAEETHLVAATLIATVTFAAGFTLPGGYIGEDGLNEGAAILIRSAAFQAFVIFDTTAFVLSCFAVLIHLTMTLNKDKTQLYKQFKNKLNCTFYAMVAMVFAFVTGIYAVLYPDKNLAITACVIGCVFGVAFSLPSPAEMLSNLLKKKWPQRNFYYE